MYAGQMKQAQCLRLAWRTRPRNTSREDLHAGPEKCFS